MAGPVNSEPLPPRTQREVVVYTRPGCPFCFILRAGLRRSGLMFREVDIWEDPEAAAFVRSVAHGNETVPTVVVGDLAMVNPSARQVRAAATQPDVVQESKQRRGSTGTDGLEGRPDVPDR